MEFLYTNIDPEVPALFDDSEVLKLNMAFVDGSESVIAYPIAVRPRIFGVPFEEATKDHDAWVEFYTRHTGLPDDAIFIVVSDNIWWMYAECGEEDLVPRARKAPELYIDCDNNGDCLEDMLHCAKPVDGLTADVYAISTSREAADTFVDNVYIMLKVEKLEANINLLVYPVLSRDETEHYVVVDMASI